MDAEKNTTASPSGKDPDPRANIALFNDAADAVADAKAFAQAVNFIALSSRSDECNAIMACCSELIIRLNVAGEVLDIAAEEIRQGVRE